MLESWDIIHCKGGIHSFVCTILGSGDIATLGLHLGFSAKLRIWQVSACKMEPRSGIISWLGPPPTHPQLSFSCKCCAVSPPQQSMCGVPPSQYMLSFKVVRCPHPICSTHQECMCGVPPCNSVPLPHLALSWIPSKVKNLTSSSL